jgi:hypothetical protein
MLHTCRLAESIPVLHKRLQIRAQDGRLWEQRGGGGQGRGGVLHVGTDYTHVISEAKNIRKVKYTNNKEGAQTQERHSR